MELEFLEMKMLGHIFAKCYPLDIYSFYRLHVQPSYRRNETAADGSEHDVISRYNFNDNMKTLLKTCTAVVIQSSK